MIHVAFSFTSALFLLAKSPVSLETVTKVTYLHTVHCVRQLHPLLEWRLISTTRFGNCALPFPACGLVCDLCLDMLETEEAQGMLRYYLCLPFLCLLVSIPSGMHIFKLIFCVAIHISGVWVLLVFMFGLISCLSVYVSSKRFLENRYWKFLLCTRVSLRILLSISSQTPFVNSS